MEFLLADNNFPFSVALMLMLIIALTEGVLTVIGAGMSEAIDSLLPDIEFDIEFDMVFDIGLAIEVYATKNDL